MFVSLGMIRSAIGRSGKRYDERRMRRGKLKGRAGKAPPMSWRNRRQSCNCRWFWARNREWQCLTWVSLQLTIRIRRIHIMIDTQVQNTETRRGVVRKFFAGAAALLLAGTIVAGGLPTDV